jgi:hypothetical protein
MTTEKFQIHYLGTLGDYVGSVFAFQRGQRQFNAESHPHLFQRGQSTSKYSLRIPDGWEIVSGIDTGTFFSALVVAFDPDGNAYVIDESPNYDYKAGEIEVDESLTIPEWVHRLEEGINRVGGRFFFWGDRNSQFKRELKRYGIHIEPNYIPNEARTEICREYFVQNRIFLAPWLRILPFELENASWPAEASASGKFERVKDRDHTLDPLEHILSRRPRGQRIETLNQDSSWAKSLFGRKKTFINPHLGAN